MTETTTPTKPRLYPTALASLFVATGAGHVAAGHLQRGLFWFLADLIGFSLAVAGALVHIGFIWLAYLWLLALRVTALFDVLTRPVAKSLPRWANVFAIWVVLFGSYRVAALAARTYVIESYKTTNGSMSPTLLIGDHFMVDKWRAPERGDLVVFGLPGEEDKKVVKRVMAVAGDMIEIRDDVIYINDKPVERQHVEGDCHYPEYEEVTGDWQSRACDAWQETFNGKTYRVIFDSATARFSSHSSRPYRVPANNVFVMGDNRDNSYDSRNFGPVARAKVTGRAYMIWWSWGEGGARLDRLFQTL
jgi:signal peptidase I